MAEQLPRPLAEADIWTDDMVARAGLAVTGARFVSVGGGIGSFITVDYLGGAGGMATRDIRVLSNLTYPWQTYEHLVTASQVGHDERIRSDSSSRPDNLWGFPSYALQEALVRRSPRPLLQVLVEPVLADFYTPRLRDVLAGLAREAQRIGYRDMLMRGDVLMVRRRRAGGFFAVLAPHAGPDQPSASGPAPAALRLVRCDDVHLGVGYPGLRFLPELRRLRAANDFHHVVNAYEDHEHVYEALSMRPGTVLVRGGGIVASQVVHRLIDERLRGGTPTRIVHLLRTYVHGSHGPSPWSRRRGGGGMAYQGFNYPKSVWGGQLRARMRKLDNPAQLMRQYERLGGTTTVWRRGWQSRLRQARRDGWYQSLSGVVDRLEVDPDGVTVSLQLTEPRGATPVSGADEARTLRVDYVVDCTGLDDDVSGHQVLADLLEHGGARRNPLGRMAVDRSFVLTGSTSGSGRIYVSGAAAYGGHFPGVDTFLGLQIAAQEIVDDLARRGRCRRMGPLRSTGAWLRWVAGKGV